MKTTKGKIKEEKKMNEEKKSWIIISEWLTILGTLLACFFFLFTQIQSLGDDLKDINISLNARIDQVNTRIDQENARIAQISARIDQENARIDQMYLVLLKTLENTKGEKS